MTKPTKANKAPKAATPAPAAPAQPAAGSKVGKAQLVERTAEQSGLTKQQSEQAVTAAMDVIVQAILQGQSVGLPGLGTLSVKPTAARTGVKPGTAERIQIPAGQKVSFKVATTLKNDL